MIIKASQRGGGQNLAVHLLRTDENEHVELHELRGFTSDVLKGAFKESEAISLGTKCRQYLFSVSFSPPEGERVPVDAFVRSIDKAEEKLGLEGQPRAIIFHEKEGRRHAHCVWSSGKNGGKVRGGEEGDGGRGSANHGEGASGCREVGTTLSPQPAKTSACTCGIPTWLLLSVRTICLNRQGRGDGSWEFPRLRAGKTR